MRLRAAAAASALLFALLAAGGGAIVRQEERVREALAREGAAQAAAGAALAIEQQLSRSLSATYALAAIVRQHGRVDDFDALAAELLSLYGGISSLQLAPGGVVAYVHPLAGNEVVLGHDLLRDPDRRFQAHRAVQSRQLTLAGPFELRQGGTGVVGRLPVFVRWGSADAERLWGFATVVVRVDALLAAAQVTRLADEGYAFALVQPDAAAGEVNRIVANGAPGGARAVTFPVKIPGGEWLLTVEAARPSVYAWRVAGWVVVLVGAAALAGLAFVVLRQPEVLRREVAARTAELARANARLADEAERQRRTEAALRHAQKMEAVGRLAGGIAHDFNNVLTAVLANAELLASQSAPGSEAHELATTIVAASNRATGLTRQLLGFARRGKLLVAPLDAHEVVREVIRLLSRTLGNVRIVERLGAAPSVVVGDPGQLQQALLNLAVNARDAMPSGGELAFESAAVEADAAWCERHPGTSPGRHLAITVADTGHGIPREIRQRVFEPFFTTKEPGHGTGMGLAMVYGIAQSHGGGVDLESEEGCGTRVTVWLPAPADSVVPEQLPEVPAPRRGSGRVLVVDDDPAPRAAVKRMLERSGYEVSAFASGEDAVRWFREHGRRCDAVLLDLAMPGMDGAACFAALRELRPEVRVVLMSGHGENGEAQRLLDAGVAAFLPKPFGLAELAAAIARVDAAA